MDLGQRSFLLACCLLALTVGKTLCSYGPVFINPDAPQPAANLEATQQGNLVTQTVYGFLDFTTTIGNTVMVFSPQSAAKVDTPQEKKDVTSNTVIETKPQENKEVNIVTIEPSKPIVDNKKPTSSEKSIISVVQVHTSQPSEIVSKIEVVTTPSSKVNIVEAKSSQFNIVKAQSSIVNIVKPEVVSSKVEVVEETPKTSTPNIITKVEVVEGPVSTINIPVISSKVEVQKASKEVVQSIIELKVDDEPAVVIGNNIGEPEYDFLSRQPSEVVEETYKVINLKPSSKFHLKPRASANKGGKRQDTPHPTGLVTKLGGTVIKDGTTTVHETSVIGTFISGKYAQVLQSTSHIYNNQKGGKINPSPTLRILKTAAPQLKGKPHRHLDPTPVASVSEENSLPVEQLFGGQNTIKSTRKPVGTRKFKNRASKEEKDDAVEVTPQPKKPKNRSRTAKHSNTSHRSTKNGRSGGRKKKPNRTTTPSSVSSEEPTTSSFGSGKRFQRKNKQRISSENVSSNSNSNSGGFSRRSYKPKVQASTVEAHSATTSLYKFKLNRSPGRWQYKTSPKPRVTIRKTQEDEALPKNETINGSSISPPPQDIPPLSNDVVTPQARSDDVDGLEGSESIASIVDDSTIENKLDNPFPLETVKVEISTPPDFKDIYYEIATIKSPYTFQVGSVRNTRYITVTSTFEKSLVNTPEATISPSATEPLTENILATSSNYGKDNNFLDSSIATLPPLYLESGMETPPLETLTETFSTTQTMLKTHILPVVKNGNETMSSTLVQTYLVTRLVTATKTLPPMEAYHFIPSRVLNEFNSHLDEAGSELHLELEFGDQNEQDDGEGHQRRISLPDLDLANIGSDFDLSDVDKSKLLEGHLRLKKAHPITTPKPAVQEPITPQGLNPDQLQQLALLRLLNPAAAQQGQVITTSKPVIKVETLYESHVIPVTQGHNTILSTISKIKGTITKTDYEFGTSTLPPALPQIPQIPQLPQIPQNPFNPLLPQQQFAVTTSPIVQTTIVTQTQSKILKLTFGAKTAYTTVYSTKVVPTVLTTYMTASVAVQPTAAAFPGYFPAPYPQFPFVG
ncbi:unnamed protein product [Brassicogethes aeneus]|uniref:DUF4758 domain-containing protein n=1 Tax=Brassicogethes aeneus TaxID=1431903 RepID=A0A9P0FKE5_BRAAE|nr:unnamed protein product [Brassicogethes aeneus]